MSRRLRNVLVNFIRFGGRERYILELWGRYEEIFGNLRLDGSIFFVYVFMGYKLGML